MKTVLTLALAIAAALAATAFGLQTTLPLPGGSMRLAARVVGRLEQIRRIDTLITLPGGRTVTSRCTAHPHSDLIKLSDGHELLVTGTHVHLVAGRWQQPLTTAAEADLALCSGLLSDELTATILTNTSIRELTRTIGNRPAYLVRIQDQPPILDLAVAPGTLNPIGLRFTSRRLNATSHVIAIRLIHR